MIQNFEIIKGDVESAINIMKEVAQWCENTGKKMWKINELSKDILLKGIKEEKMRL